MLSKIVLLFLAGIALLGIFGKLRVGFRRQPKLDRFCPACGTPRAGRGPCPCGKGA